LAWHRNVRAIVADETWETLRWHFGATQSYPRNYDSADWPFRANLYKLKCAYCGTEQKTLQSLDLHEEWHYDDTKRIQRLVGLKPICSKCHLSKHLGYANATGRTDEALSHISSVNGWTAQRTKEYSDRAFELWKNRSNISYEIDVNYLSRYIPLTKVHIDWLDNPHTVVGSRLDAIVWANRLLDSNAIVLDTETTGLLEKANVEVIELAAINMKGKVVYQSLFRTRYKIPVRVIKIHGITNEEVKASPTFAQQVEEITTTLSGKTIVTFNARFDREVIERTFKLHRAEGISARWECAMRAYRTFSGSEVNLRLPGSSHRALADCRATLKLIRKMARAHEQACSPCLPFGILN
jgi:DNA polymerase-3 subunit epsilon